MFPQKCLKNCTTTLANIKVVDQTLTKISKCVVNLSTSLQSNAVELKIYSSNLKQVPSMTHGVKVSSLMTSLSMESIRIKVAPVVF